MAPRPTDIGALSELAQDPFALVVGQLRGRICPPDCRCRDCMHRQRLLAEVEAEQERIRREEERARLEAERLKAEQERREAAARACAAGHPPVREAPIVGSRRIIYSHNTHKYKDREYLYSEEVRSPSRPALQVDIAALLRSLGVANPADHKPLFTPKQEPIAFINEPNVTLDLGKVALTGLGKEVNLGHRDNLIIDKTSRYFV